MPNAIMVLLLGAVTVSSCDINLNAKTVTSLTVKSMVDGKIVQCGGIASVTGNLDLSDNQLTTLPPDLFDGLTMLKGLWIETRWFPCRPACLMI
mmetsp:Transcript_32803/g.64300  ORF Transcript_32803/g.64300 Transcript_32803/m.64300 type:complete len:94 (-) Transcript_32803:44-325(-)